LVWSDGFADGHQELIHLPGSRSYQSGHKSSRFTSEEATKLDSRLDYKPPFSASVNPAESPVIYGAHSRI